jgi:acyl-coenzyme A thioesterase PaaI-like protein
MMALRVILPELARMPLFRLLGINLAIGIAVAVLAVGGLLALDPHRLRTLILADQSPAIALVLLSGGFIITFASVAMGSAIMGIGRDR